jgi:hypothetical protein
VSIRNNITIICFTVPLCSCITSLGSEQPLLFYLLYSFIPTKTKQKKGNSYFFYTPPEVGRSNLLCYSVFFLLSCKVAPLGGGFFRRKEPQPGHGCVCMSIRG